MRAWTATARAAQRRGDRRALQPRRARRSRAVLRPRPERLRRVDRPDAAARARARPRRRGGLPGPGRLSGRGAPARRSRPTRSARRAAAASGSSSRAPTGPASRSPCSTPASTRATRSSRGGSCPGSTCSTPDGDPTRRAEPHRARPARAPRDRARGPRRGRRAGRRALRGVAPGASILPIRVAGLAAGHRRRRLGLRPHRPAARRARGRGRPERRRGRPRRARGSRSSASSSRSPPSRTARWRARAAARSALDTLVVAPAGNDGPAGPGLRQHRGARRRPRACSASQRPTRAAGARPCTCCSARGSACWPPARRRSAARSGRTTSVTAPVVALPRRQIVAVTRGNALARLFDGAGYSRVAGKAVLLPSGPTTPEAVRELAAAGHARGARRRADPGRVARPRRDGRRADRRGLGAGRRAPCGRRSPTGVPVELGVGAAVARRERRSSGPLAPFSSLGLALDGGAEAGDRRARRRARDVGARAERGRGGALRHDQRLERRSGARRRARQRCSPRPVRISTPPGCRGALVASARLGQRRRRTRASPIRSRPPRSSSSPTRRSSRSARSTAAGGRSRPAFTLRNVSVGRLVVRMLPGTAAGRRRASAWRRARFALQPGDARVVRLSIRARARLAPPGSLEGAVRGGRRARGRGCASRGASPSRSATGPSCSRVDALDTVLPSERRAAGRALARRRSRRRLRRAAAAPAADAPRARAPPRRAPPRDARAPP